MSYNCLNRGHNYTSISVTCNINVDIILKNGPGVIQEAVDDIALNNTIICKECKKHTSRIFSYGPHLIFDTSIVTDIEYLKRINIERVNFTLDNVATNIIIGNTNYSLAGIVSYIKYGNYYNNGHYIAYTG